MTKSLLFAAAAVAGLSFLPTQSQASEWGCQVLLCVSGNWQAEPTCHPPMTKLIAAMKLPGFSWPTCPSASSGAPGYQKYEQCPVGWRVASRVDSDRGQSEGDICKATKGTCGSDRGKIVNQSKYRGGSSDRGTGSCYVEVEMPRPRKDKPYFIEYRDSDNKKQMSWFNLNL